MSSTPSSAIVVDAIEDADFAFKTAPSAAVRAIDDAARPRRTATHLIALFLMALASPAVASFSQWASFSRHEGPLNTVGYDAVVLWLFYVSTQCLLLAGTLVAAALIWRGWWRSGWTIALAWQLAVLAVAEADRQTYARTNLHLREYVGFLFTPAAIEWGGEIRLGPYFGTLLLKAARDVVLVPLAASIGIAMLLARRTLPRTRVHVARGLAALLIAACLGVIPAQGLYADRGRLVRAHASLPLNFRWLAPGVAFVNTGAFERAFNARLGGAAARIWNTTSVPAQAAAPTSGDARCDVVLIIVESLRADALAPDVMPRTSALARDGTRLGRHVSGAKFTQFGIYNLLSGRPAFCFQGDINRDGRAPMAAATFRRLGYATRFFSSSIYEWRGLERFIDGGTFRIAKEFQRGSWPVSDQLTMQAARAFFAQPSAEPRFAAIYLTSTHFPYKYPKPFERFEPTISSGTNIVKLADADGQVGLRNRYRNACAFLDDEIGSLIGTLDLSRTIVAITGDHGESFWDDNSLSHGGRWSDIVTRVPCVMIGAGVPTNVDVAEPTSHQDVAPTLLGLAAGRRVPLAGVVGRDVFASPAAEADGVRLLCSEATERYAQALFARGERRLLIEFPRGSREAIVLGAVDLKGSVDPFDAPPADEADAWADGIRAMIDAANPGDAPEPVVPKRRGKRPAPPKATQPVPAADRAAVE